MQTGKNISKIAIIIFLFWAIFFIFRTSAVGLDGNRYWVLFDDGMISMRYALNLVNGFGLTWNPGEYVEGFTNPLWTLLMALSIAVFGKLYAPLVIQLLGLLLVTFSVILTKKCADKLFGPNSRWSNIAWLLVMTYYPLMYWSLGGMEVSALAFFMAFVLYVAICVPSRPYAISLLYGTLCTAYLIRPDGFIALLPALVIHYINSSEDARTLWKRHSWGVLLLLTTILLLTLWRYSYYGEWLPNTYTLKLSGYDLTHRLQNGANFVGSFIISTVVLWIFIGYAIYRRDKNWGYITIFLVSMPVIACVYQLYVGGDPWLYWRQLAPAMIPLILVAVLGFRSVVEKLTLPQFKKTSTLVVLSLLMERLGGRFLASCMRLISEII
jgi:arabinofuranosyltransferase